MAVVLGRVLGWASGGPVRSTQVAQCRGQGTDYEPHHLV